MDIPRFIHRPSDSQSHRSVRPPLLFPGGPLRVNTLTLSVLLSYVLRWTPRYKLFHYVSNVPYVSLIPTSWPHPTLRRFFSVRKTTQSFLLLPEWSVSPTPCVRSVFLVVPVSNYLLRLTIEILRRFVKGGPPTSTPHRVLQHFSPGFLRPSYTSFLYPRRTENPETSSFLFLLPCPPLWPPDMW